MKFLFLIFILHLPLFSYDEKDIFYNNNESEEIISPFASTQTIKPSTLAKIINVLSIKNQNFQMITIPVFQNSKDLGSETGIMPIIAFKNKKDDVKTILAPAYTYNENLKSTFFYRHYFFPDKDSILMGRISLSKIKQKEFIFWYNNSNFLDKKLKFDFEFLDRADPKFSFYGYGPNSLKGNRANYIFYSKGFDFTLSFPLSSAFYFDYMFSFYKNKINNGVINNDFSIKYPIEYNKYKDFSNFLTNKFSILFDTVDHPFLPKIGNYYIFSLEFSRKNLGSDLDYSVYSIEGKKYYNYGENKKHVTAIRYLLEWHTGSNIPFYRMSILGENSGLRMAGDGRFTDMGKFVLNIEQRFTISSSPFLKFISELEMAPFIDIGTVFPKVSKFSVKNFLYGPGIAFRILIRPYLVTSLNLAYGNEGFNGIIKISYPF